MARAGHRAIGFGIGLGAPGRLEGRRKYFSDAPGPRAFAVTGVSTLAVAIERREKTAAFVVCRVQRALLFRGDRVGGRSAWQVVATP